MTEIKNKRVKNDYYSSNTKKCQKITKLVQNVILTSIILSTLTPTKGLSAEVSGLVPCSASASFSKRLDTSVKTLSSRLANYEKGSQGYLNLTDQIERTKIRFDTYKRQGLLCGAEGLPHLIADGRPSHAGEFLIPGVIFLYIAGYIGWAGRSYLQYSTKLEGDEKWDREIIINVPLALGYMSGSFIWPFSAWKELVAGTLIVPNEEVTVSPR